MLIKRQEYFFVPLILLLVTLTATNFIPLLASILVVVFAIALSLYQYFLQHNKSLGFYLCWFVAIICGIAVGLYRPPNFSYPLVFSVNQLYDGGLPFSLYVNIAKLFAGYIIVCLLFIPKSQEYIYIRAHSLQYVFAIAAGIIVVVMACLILDLRFHPKPLNYIVMFGVANLLVTCVAEEAFMRLLLQAQIHKFLSSKIKNAFWLEVIPLAIATVIFIATHFATSFNAILVFGLAGFIYGLVYSITKNLWACVAVHFTVNIIHFSLLTYPLA